MPGYLVSAAGYSSDESNGAARQRMMHGSSRPGTEVMILVDTEQTKQNHLPDGMNALMRTIELQNANLQKVHERHVSGIRKDNERQKSEIIEIYERQISENRKQQERQMGVFQKQGQADKQESARIMKEKDAEIEKLRQQNDQLITREKEQQMQSLKKIQNNNTGLVPWLLKLCYN